MSNAILDQAQMLIDQEQYENAYELLEGSYDKLKNNEEYIEKIALTAKTLEKTEDAAKYWEELIALNPNSIVAYSELLDIYNEKNKYKYYVTRAKYKILNEKVSQSIDDYKKAIDSTDVEEEIINARFLRAKSYEHLGKTQSAIDDYYRILEYKDDMAIYYKLADMYVQMNDNFSAINILDKGTKVFPNNVELNEFFANLLMRDGQFDKALEHAVHDFSKAKIYLMKGDNESAIKVLNSIEDKKNANYPALMAEYYFNLKDWDNCRKYISDFRELSPENPLVYQMLALVHEENNDDYGYHYYMGRCYSYRQNYEMALAEYLNAHRFDQNGTEAIKEIIKINETLGDNTSLMEFYEKLYRQEPDNPIALKGLGDIYANMYEFKNAIEYYEKLAKTEPNNYEAYRQLGFCYEKIKNNTQAKESYEKYLAKAPLSPDTEKIKEKLSKLDSSTTYAEANSEEGFIDKIMKFFGK
ncbi:tetratricopeptide repeat protein [bacterium]|nr:tetratricopeptide repeat protein [bacterium]